MHRDQPRPSLLRHLAAGLVLAALPALGFAAGFAVAGAPVKAVTAAYVAITAFGVGLAGSRWSRARHDWRNR